MLRLLHGVNPVEYLGSSKAIHTHGRIHTMSFTKYDAIDLLHGVNPVEYSNPSYFL